MAETKCTEPGTCRACGKPVLFAWAGPNLLILDPAALPRDAPPEPGDVALVAGGAYLFTGAEVDERVDGPRHRQHQCQKGG
jgi:hypothetical protein